MRIEYSFDKLEITYFVDCTISTKTESQIFDCPFRGPGQSEDVEVFKSIDLKSTSISAIDNEGENVYVSIGEQISIIKMLNNNDEFIEFVNDKI